MDATTVAEDPAAQTPLRRVLLLSLAAALALAAVSMHGSALDRQVFQTLNALALPMQLPASWLSVLGTGVAAVVLAAAAGPWKPRPTAALVLTVVFGGLVVHALKLWVGQPRPLGALGPHEVQVVGIALHKPAS